MDWREKAKRRRRNARITARFNGPMVAIMGLALPLVVLAEKKPVPVLYWIGIILYFIAIFGLGVWGTWWGWQKDKTHRDIG